MRWERLTISQLTNPNETRHVFVEDLETTAVFFWLTRISEASGTVEDLREGLEIDY